MKKSSSRAPGIRVVKRNAVQQAAFIAGLHALGVAEFERPFDGSYVPGEFYAANESRFNESFYSSEVTGFVVGWRDPADIDAALDFFNPLVEVSERFEYKETINAEQFLSDTVEDLRSIGSAFKIIPPPKGVDVFAKTENRGLSMVVDADTIKGKSDWELRTAEKIMRRLKRNQLRRGTALLSAAAVNTAKTWDTTAGKDPDMDVINEQVTSVTASGVGFNRVGYGHTAWSKRMLAHRAQNSGGGIASAGLTQDTLAGLLSVEKVHVDKTRFQSAAAAKSEIVGAKVLMFQAMDTVDKDDPSNIKRFQSRCDNGEFYKVYVQQISAKIWVVTVELYELQRITSTLGIRQLTIS